MAQSKSGSKGHEFEELLRAYFLRAGFYVLRGVPIRFDLDDATDADLWLYERPTGSARRRQVADAKFKQRPKAAERLLWTRGLVEILGLDGAYVATTDKRKGLRTISRRLGITLIDGADLNRMRQNESKIRFDDRLTEEEFQAELRAVDQSRKSRNLFESMDNLKGSVANSFGPSLINIALDSFARAAYSAVTSHRDSAAARTSGRLAYFSASVAAAALDYVSVEEPFKSTEERLEIFKNAVRFGSASRDAGTERIRLAAALVRRYASNGPAIAATIERSALADFEKIPAEIIAEQSVKMTASSQLFSCARSLEHSAFARVLPAFDNLCTQEKSFLGALLDFSDIDRSAFAQAWSLLRNDAPSKMDPSYRTSDSVGPNEKVNEEQPGPLFKPKS
ncbi:MAG: hypothetical protein AAFY02_01565 [Pseudomonadota bacterium]